MGTCEEKLGSNITFLHINACMWMFVYTCLYNIHLHVYAFITVGSNF